MKRYQIPIESDIYPGFYEIPFFSNYVLSPCGKVINKLSGKFLNGSINPKGYHNFRLTRDDGGILTIGIHRLIGLTLKNPDENIDKLVINHLDGIKRNNSPDNLEWTTYQGNLEHAGKLGLTTKCCPVSVREIDTDIVRSFPSALACANFYGVSKDFILYRIREENYSRVFYEKRQYWRTCKKDPGLNSNFDSFTINKGRNRKVLLRELITNRIFKFDKQSDLAKYLNISPSVITEWLKEENQPVLPGLIQLKREIDLTPWRHVDDPELEMESRLSTVQVETIYEATGKITKYMSAIDCARALKINASTLNNRLKSNGSVVFRDGFRYRYSLNTSCKKVPLISNN